MRRIGLIALLVLPAFAPVPAAPGMAVTAADYDRAASFLPGHVDQWLRQDGRIHPHWIDGGSRFWYRDVQRDGHRFMHVDPEAATRSPVFDHPRLARAANGTASALLSPDDLPVEDIAFRDGQPSLVTLSVDGRRLDCVLPAYACRINDVADADAGADASWPRSPDARWAVSRRGHDLVLHDRGSGEQIAITRDGHAGASYGSTAGVSVPQGPAGLPVLQFSPDSSRFVTWRINASAAPTLPLVTSRIGEPPTLGTQAYSYPGGGGVTAELMIFEIAARRWVPARMPAVTLLPNDDHCLCWSADGRTVYVRAEARGYRAVDLLAVDAVDGSVATLATEQSETALDRWPVMAPLSEGGFLWSSEHSGWRHLYLLDGDGRSPGRRQLTDGDWVVRDFVREDDGWIYFTAAGLPDASTPYYRQLHRVRRDGGGWQRLTPEDADHEIVFSPDGRYFLDTYSRVDLPPVTVLRERAGAVRMAIAQADVTDLMATGWRYPERFRVKARDGSTDLHGIIIRPSHFDPTRTYPVLDSIYPGPQSIHVPQAFAPAQRDQAHAQALAELGFVVVMLDGMGTPLRSRAFREVSYRNLGDAGGLEDHVVALRALAREHRDLDLDRVGVYGHSAGGYAAARAILRFPDVYKVAVASAGNHDQRLYHAGWGERFQGYPVDAGYATAANASLAAGLQGHLLLAHGDSDDNVHVAHTLQLAEALIAANKDFDLLLLPNRGHGLADPRTGAAGAQRMDTYFIRRRWDYFVRHLLGATPPRAYSIHAPQP